MNKPSQVAFNFTAFLLLLLLAITLQTSLFHWILGGRPTLQIAILIITYICLYRSPVEALIFTVIGSYCLGLASTMLQSVAVFGGMCIFIVDQVIKKQVYSSGSVHFTWTALCNILIFHASTWIVTSVFESFPPQLRPMDWILEVLITALVTKIMYRFFIVLDQKTKRIEIGELER